LPDERGSPYLGRLCRTRRFRRVFAVCGSSSRFPSSERGTARAAGSVHQIKRRSKLAAQNAVETRQTWPVARGPDGRGLALRPIRAVALPPHSRGTAGRFAHVTEIGSRPAVQSPPSEPPLRRRWTATECRKGAEGTAGPSGLDALLRASVPRHAWRPFNVLRPVIAEPSPDALDGGRCAAVPLSETIE